jgi:FdhD protein
VAVTVNGIAHAVMLATPADLDDFARGFALTEGLVDGLHQVHDIDEQHGTDGITLSLTVASACAQRLKQRRRALAGSTGCGLCGVEQLAQLRPAARGVQQPLLTAGALARAHRALRPQQPLGQCTGATHAAAWCAPDGRLLLVREDVGRHNALDKLIGALLHAGHDPAAGFVAISSRASLELVLKCTHAGIGALAAVSAPTALAARTAQTAGLLLAGFVRDDDLVLYAGRLAGIDAPPGADAHIAR